MGLGYRNERKDNDGNTHVTKTTLTGTDYEEVYDSDGHKFREDIDRYNLGGKYTHTDVRGIDGSRGSYRK